MSLLDKLHTTFKWTVPYEGLLTQSNPQTKSEKFAMAEDPNIEWVLVLKLFNNLSSGAGRCYCCSYNNRPGYQTQSGKRIISLYLENCKAYEEPVYLNISFSILDDNNDQIFTRKEKISGENINAGQYGFDKFISEEEICPNLLVNNSLNILCEIKIDDDTTSEKLSFLKGFDSFINDETFSDVVLFIGEKKIYAHKLILSASPVFRKMFLTDMKESNSNEAKVNDITFEVFNELLRFMYTGKVEKLDELGFEIFKAAHFYQIDDLKLICEHVLRKTLKIDNSIDVLKLADDHNAEVLKEHCVAFILKNFKAVMRTAAFQNLNATRIFLSNCSLK